MQLNKSKGGMSLVGEIIVIKNMGKYLHDIRLSDIRYWPRVISVKKKNFFRKISQKRDSIERSRKILQLIEKRVFT